MGCFCGLSSIVYGPPYTTSPHLDGLAISLWGDGARAGKLRRIFWKRCLSHRVTVESPVIGLFSLARPKC